MFIKNIKNIMLPKDTISVDYATKEYLQQHGFMPIGFKDNKWVFCQTETLINILETRQKEVGNGADS